MAVRLVALTGHLDKSVVYCMAPPSSLQQQLLSRVAKCQQIYPYITKADIAKHCGIGEANFSAAIAGRRGLSADSILQLHRLMNLPKHQVVACFGNNPPTSTIKHLQQNGESMRLDSDPLGAWYPGSGGSGAGVDPNDTVGRSIDSSVIARDLPNPSDGWEATLDGLRTVRGYHRKAISIINDFVRGNKVNQGSTAPTSQKFSAIRILKAVNFGNREEAGEAVDATQDLLDTLGTLDVVTRKKVIGAILAAFPYSLSDK